MHEDTIALSVQSGTCPATDLTWDRGATHLDLENKVLPGVAGRDLGLLSHSPDLGDI